MDVDDKRAGSDSTVTVESDKQLPTVTVDSFTVSCSMDVYKGRDKESCFVSAGFKTSRPVTPEELIILSIEQDFTVHKSAIYNMLARGVISIEQANENIQLSKDRHEKIKQTLSKAVTVK
jgi:hypothetical protein